MRENDPGASNEGLMSKYESTGENYSYVMYIQSSGDDKIRTAVYTDGSPGSAEIVGPDMVVDKWYYIVVTYTGDPGINGEKQDGGDNKLTQYVNGVYSGSASLCGNVGMNSRTGNFEIGSFDGGTYFFEGRAGGVFVGATAMTHHEVKAEYQRGLRRLNSTIDTNDTIADNDVASLATDPTGKYVTVMGDDESVYIFDEFAVPVASDTYPGTSAADGGIAIKSMLNGPDPHYVMAGSDQIEIVQPNTKIGA